MSLAETHVSEARNVPLDDFVAGKDEALLFSCSGPPGVGKTLTAKALSEYLKKSLYPRIANCSSKSRTSTTRISESAKRWKALFLLDKADMYVEQRSSKDLVRNGLVSMFLRKLEYYEGIMFLTTNRVSKFDVAILSRIYLMFKYDDLSKAAGRQIWEQFIRRAGPTEVKP